MQIEYADKMSLGRLGAWLVRRTHHCETKLREALADLKACDVAEEVLRAQWANQIAVQTKPLQRKSIIPCTLLCVLNPRPGQSKTAGQAAVEQVIQARHKTQSLFERVKSLEEILTCNDSPVEECLYAEMALPDARKAHKNARDRAAQLERGLGVDDTTVVQKLKHAEYYTARMNGKALKERLRAKLRDRKFELDPIERSFRRTRSGE